MTCDSDAVVRYWNYDMTENKCEIKAHTNARRMRIDMDNSDRFAVGGNVRIYGRPM